MSSIDPDTWRRISEHIDRLLELSAEARAGYLASLGHDEPEIAAQLGQLLAGREQTGFDGFLSGAGPRAPDPGPGATFIGSPLGAYVLEAEVGRGGMGSVWRARRADGRFEGRVAVKLLSAALVGRPAEQRFIREGQILANLSHANIAQLLDAGVAPSGQAYLVLEYVAGLRIDQYCEANRLTSRQRIGLFLDVLAAVAHAHSHLIVHRDLKPSNILVTDDGRVKLLDFGVAGLLPTDGAVAASPLTIEAGSAFTPEYAAPEQLLNQTVTTATDVYALGLVLFVLLAGRHPRADGGESALQRMRTIVEQDAPLLSRCAVDTDNVRTLRGDLDTIVGKTLKRDPADRYATVDAFADDLRRYLGNEPVRARPDSLSYRAAKFALRHRGGVLTGMLTAIGLFGLSIFAWAQMREAQLQRDEAVRQQKNAEIEASFVSLMFGSVGAGDRPLVLTDVLDRGLVLLDREFGSDRPFVVRTLIQMSGRYMDLGNTAKEHAVLARAEQLAREVGDPALLAAVECNAVETDIAAGRPAEAGARLKEGQSALARARSPGMNDAIDCMHADASLADATGDGPRATALVLRAVAMLELGGEAYTRGLRYTGLLSHASYLLGKQGNEVASFEYAEKSLRALEQLGRGDTESAIGARHNVASSLKSFGEIREALQQERALITQLEGSDPTAAIAPPVSATYGELLARMGEPAAAITWLDRAVSDAVASGNTAFEVGCRVKRARVLVQLNRLADADADLGAIESRTRGQETLFRDVRQSAAVVRSESLLARGLPEQAAETVAPILNAIPRPLANGQSAVAGRALMTASRIALGAGRLGEAERFADDAAEIARRRARRPGSSADVGEATLLKAEVLRSRGAMAAAQEAARAAVGPLTLGLGPSHPMTLTAVARAR